MAGVEQMFPESCRVCLKCCKQSRCLLIKSKHNKSLIKMLSSLIKSELILDPEWPSHLCKNCEEELVTTYNFLEKCRTTDIKITDCKTRGNLKLEGEDTSCTSIKWDNKSNKIQSTTAKTAASNVESIAHDNDLSLDTFENDVADDDEIIDCPEQSKPFEFVKIELETTNRELASNKNKEVSEDQVVANKKHREKRETLDSRGSGRRKSVTKKPTQKPKENVVSEKAGFCEKCNRNTGDVKKHNYIFHESATARIFEECKKGDDPTCKICGKKFKSNITLRGHIKLVHTDELPYKCRFCKRPTQSSTALIAHERLHTGEKPFICHYCGKSYPNKINLQSHLVQHTGKKHFCKVCGKAFSRNSFLQLHMKRHTGEFSYLCTQCGKKFIVTASYKEHLRIHTNERPFKCDICEKTFKKRSTWRRHLGIHSGYKPLKCKYCPYSCAVPYRMRQHMKTHNKEVVSADDCDSMLVEMPSQ